MNVQKELVLDNYKKDLKVVYEIQKNLFRIYFCFDLNFVQIDIYEINMYIYVKIIIYYRYIYLIEIKLKERKSMKCINLEFVFYFKIEYFFFNFVMMNNLFCF